ncbi:PilN domain-containing protein [Vreelandella zhanjiangensis]|uniref:PilN domain-containing protein n=1 Tax=Vreelandella zhanjiangensis TaxID=1121960 RepID=UPI00402AA344
MTIDINLLAWREARREKHTRRFYAVMLLLLIVGIALGGVVAHVYQRAHTIQEQRNVHIAAHIERFDHEIAEAERYVKKVEQLSQQLTQFQRLFDERVQTPQLFNAFASSLTEGVTYRRLERQEHQISVSAVADNERQVSEQLRRLAEMPGLGVPLLSEVSSVQDGGSVFHFEVTQTGQRSTPADGGGSP